MNPDTPETRILRLEGKVAKLEQLVEDFLAAIKTQFAALDADVRAFAPMAREVNDLQHKLALALSEAQGARAELKDLREALEERAEQDRLERIAAEQRAEDRAERDSRERKSSQRWLIMAILASASIVIAAIQVLSGFG